MSKRLLVIVISLLCAALPCFSKDAKTENPMENKKSSAVTSSGPDNPFGVLEFLHWNHEWNNYKYSNYKELNRVIALMKQAHVGWVRMDFVWGDIEPARERFDFNKYDYLVGLLHKNNIQILGILDYSADWASECGEWNCRPKDNALFVNYAVKVVERYKDKVKYWEVWNEPDSGVYWKQQDGLKSYCELQKDVYTTLKKVDPDCKILNGGFANGASSINHFYDNGAGPYCDILNIHIFESPLHYGAAKRILSYVKIAKKIKDRNGDKEKKIWVTEIGCPGVRSSKVKNWWMGKNPSERQQAKWVNDVYKTLLSDPSVEKVFWAFFRDTKEHWNNGVDHFGLVRWNFSKKPGFTAYKKAFRTHIEKTRKKELD